MDARYHRSGYIGVGGGLRRFFFDHSVRRGLAGCGVRGGYVIDVPSGSGVASRALARIGVCAIGVDISMSMLRLARADVGGQVCARWVRADIEWLPFCDNAASAVVSLRFFTHLPQQRWKPVLEALARLTAGPVVIGLPMRWSSKHRWRALKRRFGISAKQRRIYDLAVVSKILGDAGLTFRRRIWQSPFTDTALVIARRRVA